MMSLLPVLVPDHARQSLMGSVGVVVLVVVSPIMLVQPQVVVVPQLLLTGGVQGRLTQKEAYLGKTMRRRKGAALWR